MKTYAFRLSPGKDLKSELLLFTQMNQLQAGVILTCVGSLARAALRMAGRDEIQIWNEKLEIVSMVGTLSADGVHIHLSISDGEGRTFGGHLVEGCIIYTTAEVAVGDLEELKFLHVVDPSTGFKELEVWERVGPK